MHNKPKIGVSRCLLGHPVRYDGESKASTIIIDQLDKLFELVPVCPEVEAGLSVPRPPVQLTGSIEHPRITGRDDPCLDVTLSMQAYCDSRPAELKRLSGFVFKSRSPSCGLDSTPVFLNGNSITEHGRGVFARAMTSGFPELPVVEEKDLEYADSYERFVESVYRYMEMNWQDA